MKNLNGISKLFMIKTSVGLCAILNNVSVILVLTIGGVKFSLDTEDYDAVASTKRSYSKYLIITPYNTIHFDLFS